MTREIRLSEMMTLLGALRRNAADMCMPELDEMLGDAEILLAREVWLDKSEDHAPAPQDMVPGPLRR